MSEYVIETKNLTKTFGKNTVVDNVNLKVQKGEIFGFLGPNGSGKSTTMRMLCGILSPTSGSGKVLGFDIAKEPEKIKLNIGYMTQRFSLYEDMTTEENLEFFGRVYGLDKEKRKSRKDEIITMLGLESRRNAISGTFSGGWKQRLALACALIHNPPLLFLDEPTGGVDPVSRRQFWEILYMLADMDVTCLVTTHYMDEAERCHNLGFIHTGTLIASGNPQEIITKKSQGDILEIECNPLIKSLKILQETSFIKSVSLHRDGLHAIVDNAEQTQDKILALLKENNIQVDSCKKVYPSLEDIFVSLTKEKEF
ncbi:MAG: ABC transporter ATP-binding protein [Candidatus Sericytochromatia bacterium]